MKITMHNKILAILLVIGQACFINQAASSSFSSSSEQKKSDPSNDDIDEIYDDREMNQLCCIMWKYCWNMPEGQKMEKRNKEVQWLLKLLWHLQNTTKEKSEKITLDEAVKALPTEFQCEDLQSEGIAMMSSKPYISYRMINYARSDEKESCAKAALYWIFETPAFQQKFNIQVDEPEGWEQEKHLQSFKQLTQNLNNNCRVNPDFLPTPVIKSLKELIIKSIELENGTEHNFAQFELRFNTAKTALNRVCFYSYIKVMFDFFSKTNPAIKDNFKINDDGINFLGLKEQSTSVTTQDSNDHLESIKEPKSSTAFQAVSQYQYVWDGVKDHPKSTITGIIFSGLYGAKMAGEYFPMQNLITSVSKAKVGGSSAYTSSIFGWLSSNVMPVIDSVKNGMIPSKIKYFLAVRCSPSRQNVLESAAAAGVLYGAGEGFRKLAHWHKEVPCMPQVFKTLEVASKTAAGTVAIGGLFK